MLSNISWKEYLLIIGFSLLVYYLFIAMKYYRHEIQNFLSAKGKKSNLKPGRKQQAEDISYEELDAVVFDLRYAILDKAGKNASKHDLLRQLSARLKNYTGLRKPAYRLAINNAIIQHAKDSCGIIFSEEELNEAWELLSRN